VAREALKVLVEEHLCDRAEELGEYLMARLRQIESPHVALVRGRGLFVGVVLKPEAGGARRFCEALMERGVLAKDTHGTVIRLAPPLVIKKEELDWMVEQIEAVLSMP
jgi:ornithine--oxo-acid transaminase